MKCDIAKAAGFIRIPECVNCCFMHKLVKFFRTSCTVSIDAVLGAVRWASWFLKVPSITV